MIHKKDNDRIWNGKFLILITSVLLIGSVLYAKPLPIDGITDSTGYYMDNGSYDLAYEWSTRVLKQTENKWGRLDTNYCKALLNLSEIYYYRGNIKEAIDSSYKLLSLLNRIHNKRSSEYAVVLNNIAIFYQDLGDAAKADSIFRDVLALRRKIFKGDNADLSESLFNCAYYAQLRGDFHDAEKLFTESLEMRKRLYRGDHPDIAASLGGLGNLYNLLGRYSEAENLMLQNTEMLRRLYRYDNSDLAVSLLNLANIYTNLSKYNKAEPLLKEALSIYRKIYKTENNELLTAINILGLFYYDLGKYDKAEPLLKEALEMSRRLFLGDNNDVVISLNNLAVLYQAEGRYTEAFGLFKEETGMCRRLFPHDHPLLAKSINNIAMYYFETGNYVQAEKLFREALGIRERIFSYDHPDLAESLSNLATLYRARGAYDEAEKLYQKSLQMKRRLFSGNNPDLAVSLNNIASFYEIKGDIKKADEYYTESLNMRKNLYKGDHPDIAIALENMAGFNFRNYPDRDSGPLFMQSLAMFRRLYPNDNPLLAKSIENLAYFYYKTGNYDKAEPLVKEALKMRRRLYNENHPELAVNIKFLADIFNSEGKYDKAEPFYKESLSIFTKIITGYFPYLSENEQRDLWNTLKINFNGFNTYACSRYEMNPMISGDMYNYHLLSKGILFNSSRKVRERILRSHDTELINKYNLWKSKIDQLAQLYKLPKSAAEKAGVNLDSLENNADETEKYLSERSRLFAKDNEHKTYSWTDVRDHLHRGEAAIEILRFRLIKNDERSDSVYYVVLIVKNDTKQHPAMLIFKNGNMLENEYIKEYRRLNKKQKDNHFNNEKIEKRLALLYDFYWKDINDNLKDIKTVYISTEGVYNQINLNTLFDPDAGKYLIDEIDIRNVTSTKDIIAYTNKEHEQKNKTAVLFGAPDFSLDSLDHVLIASNYNFRTGRIPFTEYTEQIIGNENIPERKIPPLPGTKAEIDSISNMMLKKNWQVNEFTGRQAVEEAIKSVNNPGLLHIATHGKFLKNVSGKRSSFGIEADNLRENPLLRSMLFFSGAESSLNTRHYSDAYLNMDDGILTAYEAMNLNLDNTGLVVLSACETGLGEVRNGESVYGFQRAFQVAGAKAVIMSLWTVNDEATQLLMKLFYEQYLGGKSKREAFRNAQLELKSRLPGFYFWGAFIMVGQ